jgi:hypothetical protein
MFLPPQIMPSPAKRSVAMLRAGVGSKEHKNRNFKKKKQKLRGTSIFHL